MRVQEVSDLRDASETPRFFFVDFSGSGGGGGGGRGSSIEFGNEANVAQV